jgi:hypothetical protein
MPCGIGGNKTTQRKLVLLYALSLPFDQYRARGTCFSCCMINRRQMAIERHPADKVRRGDGACGKTSLLNVFTRG